MFRVLVTESNERESALARIVSGPFLAPKKSAASDCAARWIEGGE